MENGCLPRDRGLSICVKRVSGRGTTRAEDAQGTPTQSHISPSILVYEDKKGLRMSARVMSGGTLRSGRSHTTRRCRGATNPESYITKYATYTKIMSRSLSRRFEVNKEAEDLPR